MSETKNDYRKTLNLPKTSFPMKANLIQNEPASLKRWAKLAEGAGFYEALREKRKTAERFVFHDGPPYANGSIHLGHLLNKCLKDFVVRSRSMMGLDCPYVPGWDCHGLPIEHRVVADLVEKGKMAKLDALEEDARRMAIRRACKDYANSQIKLQKGQMERLLTVADYENPYLTMQPEYEGAVLDVLTGLLEQGLVTRALKPVHWSIANETALADAELEYEDREDLSVYVDFEAADGAAVYRAFGLDEDSFPDQTPSFMIWTTTPWTLPANLAIAVHERFEYVLVRVDGNVTVLAGDAVERVTKLASAEDVEVLARTQGSALVGLVYRHPFIDVPPVEPSSAGACYKIVSADYVTLEDGTGLVHTAPGHGTEDYQTGQRVGLPVYCPVLGNGTYDETVSDWLVGKSIWDANPEIMAHLQASGHLFHGQKFMHSYPHDWRSKTPVIFRCTEQWFVRVEEPTKRDGKGLKELALAEVAEHDGGVEFVPAWGRNRMRGMLESRPDWCISRQRAWGLPIPAFEMPDGSSFMTVASCAAIAAVIREKGSDTWFTESPETLLAGYDASRDPDAPAALASGEVKASDLRKGHDILDVWFESGSSWNAVMRERSGGKDYPVELYLEGSDQHRGWFQLSLLPALGVTGRAPYKKLLTHGFMVDKDGKKLSKSKGATIADLFERYGADVLRWWVASLAYENDMKVDEEFFKLAGESYRKIRNTLRFMLSNLSDFEPELDADGEIVLGEVPATSLEAWVLGEYDTMHQKVTRAYESLALHEVHKEVYRFCNTALSAEYLAAVKDRLYCDRTDSERRRRAQRALWFMADGLCRLVAPVLCHTADEAYRELRGIAKDDAEHCVHLETFGRSPHLPVVRAWDRVWTLLHDAGRSVERAREEGLIENPLDAGVVLEDTEGVTAGFDAVDLADLLGVSKAEIADGGGTRVMDLKAEPRCERSWKRDGTVRERSDGGMLSDRDAAAIGVE